MENAWTNEGLHRLLSDKMDRKTFILLVLLCVPLVVWSYEAPEDKQDVFAQTGCPAFLTFINAAYVSGTTVELPCYCKPPEVQSVVWFYRKHLSSSERTEVFTDNDEPELVDPSSLRSRFSIRLFSLLIFRSHPSDSGIYICGSKNRDFFFAYDMDIQEAGGITFVDSPRRRKPRTDSKRLFEIFTDFDPWSACDRCGRPGEQVRVGLCYVHSLYLHVRYRWANETVTSCGSEAVLRVFGPISNKGAVLEVRECEEVCAPEPPLPSKLTSLMSFLGYGSDSQPIWVKVSYMTHRAETSLIMTCPGAKPNKIVAWDKEDTPLLRREHTVPPGGATPRISVDTGHNLVFNPALEEDSGVYYCWLQGKRTAQIHVLVYSFLGRGQSVLTHPDLFPALWMLLMCYIGMIAAFILLLFTKAGFQFFRGTHED